MATSTVPNTETNASDQTAVEEQQNDKGVLARLGGRVRKAIEHDTVTINGDTMTAAAGKLVRDRGMVYVGTDVSCMATKTSAGQRIDEPYNPNFHSPKDGWSKRMRVREFLRLPEGDKGKLMGGETPPAEIHMVENGRYVGAIGRRLSPRVCERLGLTPEGEKQNDAV